MLIDALVLDESEREYVTKTGVRRKEVQLSLRDAGAGDRCTNNFVYPMNNEEENDKYKGKLRDKKITVHVRKILPGFNGDLRIEGRIESANGTTAK